MPTEVPREKPRSLPVCLSQIPHGLSCDRTRELRWATNRLTDGTVSALRLLWFRSDRFTAVSWRGMEDLEVKLQLFFRFHVVVGCYDSVPSGTFHPPQLRRQRLHLNVKPISHFNLAPRWRMCGAVTPLPRMSFTSRLVDTNSKPVMSPNESVPVTAKGWVSRCNLSQQADERWLVVRINRILLYTWDEQWQAGHCLPCLKKKEAAVLGIRQGMWTGTDCRLPLND
jgi:hypothetical protein